MRKPTVSRTMRFTEANVLTVNVNDQTTDVVTTRLPRTFKDDKSLLKAVRTQLETPTIKVAHVIGTKVITKLLGMSESDFLRYATELPARQPSNDPELIPISEVSESEVTE